MLKLRWKYEARRPLTQWYGHVDYFGEYVIGQWFALEAVTGRELWSRRFFRPNTVAGVVGNTIVATETRADGPWTADFGIYALDAQSGDYTWINHGHGVWGKVLRLLDFVPSFTNEFRDTPIGVTESAVYTAGKRVLDAATGRELETNAAAPEEPDHGLAWNFYHNKRVTVPTGDTLIVTWDGKIFRIDCNSNDGRNIWSHTPKSLGGHLDGNFYSYRLHGEKVIFIIGDAPKYVPIRLEQPLIVKPNPANYSLVVVDVRSGEVTRCDLHDARAVTECRIESTRDERVLISLNGTTLFEYEFQAIPAPSNPSTPRP